MEGVWTLLDNSQYFNVGFY